MKFQECTRCVMDSHAADIQFDEQGRCNYCTSMLARLAEYQPTDPAVLDRRLKAFVETVRTSGHGRRYDCIVGVSGGADSAYALYLARQHGLRPLAVHMDNGWNSELAVNNIENLVRKLGVDLYTHVVEWREYRGLQQAFFDADVIDVELLYDNAMLAVNYNLARRYGIRYILSGSNTTTEGMRVPRNYNWNKFDRKNILDIARRDGMKVRSLPTIGVKRYVWDRLVRRIQWVPFLDFIDYNKQRCIDTLVEAVGYRPYPYKHYESIFTRFYQGFLLPSKFGVDKRRLHFSSLICSGQMSRERAKELLDHSPYPDPDDLQQDIEYFLKKMGWSENDLEAYLARPERPHDQFATEAPLYNRLLQLQKKYLAGR
ncbi:N-acetyl sugar amidotransferase [Noviherbaspirillum aridicola]|nr:N-acetyl sugar amidotransferase [Noviherbaspirillum aridicola]